MEPAAIQDGQLDGPHVQLTPELFRDERRPLAVHDRLILTEDLVVAGRDPGSSAVLVVDILVTNAALFADLECKPFMEIDEAEWDRDMQVNLRGVFTCVKAVVPEMQRNGYGKIVNISSGTVFKGTPMMLHYVSSKGAVVAFTRALAREVGDAGIRVNALAPGLTMSEEVAGKQQWAAIKDANAATRAIKRDETPEDLIGTMLFLCSSDSDFVTGQTLVCDGGSVMR